MVALLVWFCLDVTIASAHILMQIEDNHPHLTQLEFRLELKSSLHVNTTYEKGPFKQDTGQ